MQSRVLGSRIRYFRTEKSLTLADVASALNVSISQISLIETGKRQVSPERLDAIASVLGVPAAELARDAAPDSRTRLELELEDLQDTDSYAALGLPKVVPTKKMPDSVLRSLIGMHREIQRRERESSATPEEARRGNRDLRLAMREKDNFMPELEVIAEDLMRTVGHTSSAVTHHTVARMAEHLGFTLIHVGDLPDSTRSITDLKHGRIYLPPASIPGGHGLRSMALQAMAHRVLGHTPPKSYAEFLQQRLEINYFAAACLMPGSRAIPFLHEAKKNRNLAVEDFRDAFGVTHEAAALRMTNLATAKLDLNVHFLRVSEDGGIQKAYENDGLPIPRDVTGSIEGQLVCRKWSSRMAFETANRTTETYQRTDTPAGRFWCSTQTGVTESGQFSISFGVSDRDSKFFRGRDTTVHTVSTCPDSRCCKQPSTELLRRWQGQSWPSARLHAHILSPLPQGAFPGVDANDVFEFLERHAPVAATAGSPAAVGGALAS